MRGRRLVAWCGAGTLAVVGVAVGALWSFDMAGPPASGVPADEPPPPGFGAESPAGEVGMAEYRAGDPAGAVRAARAAVEHYRRSDGSPDLAVALGNLGFFLCEQGEYEAAETECRAAVEVGRRTLPATHPDLICGLLNLAHVLQARGRPGEAQELNQEADALCRRLVRQKEYPPGQPYPVPSLKKLVTLFVSQGRPGEAEILLREGVAVARRLYPAGHPDLATLLDNLANVVTAQGRHWEAGPLYAEVLTLRRRLYPVRYYPRGHRDLAASLTKAGQALIAQGRPGDAEVLLREALGVVRRLHPEAEYPAGHPDLAASLDYLSHALVRLGRLGEAELLLREALAIRRRAYPESKYPAGHPDVAVGLNSLGFILTELGKYDEAESLLQEALAVRLRLYPPASSPGGFRLLAESFHNLAYVLAARGRYEDAEPVLRDALAMYSTLAEAFAADQPDGDALTFAGSLPLTRDAYLSLPPNGPEVAARAYSAVWGSRSVVSRAADRRHLAARAAAAPAARRLWVEQADLRRRRADLLLAPAGPDPAGRDKRLEALDDRLRVIDRELAAALPAAARAAALARATPDDLRRCLPVGTAFVDLLQYTHFGREAVAPGAAGQTRTPSYEAQYGAGAGETRTPSYVAFVVTADRVARADLGPAAGIDDAVRVWRAAITAGRSDRNQAAALRRLVWDKIAPLLPSGTTAVYLVPDEALAGVPWAALPGAKPGTVLLDEYPVLTVPHGHFLVRELTAEHPTPAPDRGVLAVGGVDYGSAAAPAGPTWQNLPGTRREAEAVATLAAGRGLPVRALSGPAANTPTLLAELPKARVAHLATHGFFADEQFRAAFRVDPGLFEARGTELVGRAARSPLLASGLVVAGANNPATPGRGMVTAEALVGLDLAGLDLAVLSACDTGLGHVTGGEGVFGLQKAFHTAGCRDVVAALWKVDDDATAALMVLFYRGLWQDNLTPAAALRRAQLALYRNPGLAARIAAARGVDLTAVELPKVAEGPPAGSADLGALAPTGRWAAFTLSGPGRGPIVAGGTAAGAAR